MKYLVLILALLGTSAMAQEKPTAEYVKETLDYCLDVIEKEEQTDTNILECINAEFEYVQLQTFPSLKSIMSYVEHLTK